MNLNEYILQLVAESEEEQERIKLRNYTSDELKDQIKDVKNTIGNIYPLNVREKIVSKLNSILNYYIDSLVTYSKFDDIVNLKQCIGLSVQDIEKEYENGSKYKDKYKELLDIEFPPPIIVEYNNKKRLLCGMSNVARMFIRYYYTKTNIPAILIKVED